VDLKTVGESLIRSVCGSEFQTDDDENQITRVEKSVLRNSWTSNGMADHVLRLEREDVYAGSQGNDRWSH